MPERRKRCPNGTRRDPKTGECVKVGAKAAKKPVKKIVKKVKKAEPKIKVIDNTLRKMKVVKRPKKAAPKKAAEPVKKPRKKIVKKVVKKALPKAEEGAPKPKKKIVKKVKKTKPPVKSVLDRPAPKMPQANVGKEWWKAPIDPTNLPEGVDYFEAQAKRNEYLSKKKDDKGKSWKEPKIEPDGKGLGFPKFTKLTGKEYNELSLNAAASYRYFISQIKDSRTMLKKSKAEIEKYEQYKRNVGEILEGSMRKQYIEDTKHAEKVIDEYIKMTDGGKKILFALSNQMLETVIPEFEQIGIDAMNQARKGYKNYNSEWSLENVKNLEMYEQSLKEWKKKYGVLI